MNPYEQPSDYAPPAGPPPGIAPPQGVIPPSGPPPPGYLPGQPSVPVGYGQVPIQGIAGRGRTPSYSSALVDEANKKWGAPPVRRKPVGAPIPLPQQQQQQQQQMGMQPNPVNRTSTSSSLRGMMNTLKSKAQVEARALANTVKQYQNEHSHGAQSQNYGSQYQSYGATGQAAPYVSPDGQTYQYTTGAQPSIPQAQFQTPSQPPTTQAYQYQYPGAMQSPVTQTTTPSTQAGYGYDASSQLLQSNPGAQTQNPAGAYYPSTADLQTQTNAVAPSSQPQYGYPGASTLQDQYPVSNTPTAAYAYPQAGSAVSGQPIMADPNLPVASSPAVPNVPNESQYQYPVAPLSQGQQSVPDTGYKYPNTASIIQQQQQTVPETGYKYPGTATIIEQQQQHSLPETGYKYPGTAAIMSEPQQSVPETGYKYPGTAAILAEQQQTVAGTDYNNPVTAATATGPQTSENSSVPTNVFGQDQQQAKVNPIVDAQQNVPAGPGDVSHQVNPRIEAALQDPNITVSSTTPVVAPKPSTRIHAALLDASPTDSPASSSSAPQTNSRIEAALEEPVSAPGTITISADSPSNARINAALQEEQNVTSSSAIPPQTIPATDYVLNEHSIVLPQAQANAPETAVHSFSGAASTPPNVPSGVTGAAPMPPVQPTQSFPPLTGEQISHQTPGLTQHHAYPASAGPEPLDFHAPATVPGLSPFENFSPAPPIVQQDPMPHLNAPMEQPPVVSETIEGYGLPSSPPGPPPNVAPTQDFNAPQMPPPAPGVIQPSSYEFQPPVQAPPPGPPTERQLEVSSPGDGDQTSIIIDGMGNLSVVRNPVRDFQSGPIMKDRAWIEDVPRRSPLKMSEDGKPNEAIWFCPGNRHDNGYVAYWFYLPGAPDFLVCTRCHERYLKNTNLASHFGKIKKHGARCRFDVPRITSVLVPQCIQTGTVEPLAEYMARRTGMKDCRLKDGFKGSDGFQVYTISRDTNDIMVNFIVCQACYEDYILGSNYAGEFIPRQDKDPNPQPQSTKWICDISPGYAKRSFTIYSRNNAPFMDWVTKVTKLFQIPVCEADKGVEASSREWVRPKDPVETMVICERCYFDEICWTAIEDAFEYIPVEKPIMNSERMDYIFGHRSTQATSWTCDARVTQIENTLAGALLQQDAAVFSRCARTIMSSPTCKPEGIPNGTWYSLKGGPSNYNLCASCFAGFCDAFLECTHMFELSPHNGSAEPILCNMNNSSPRRYQFLFSLYQAMQEGVWSIALDTIRNYIDLPECPRNNHVGNRRWYGWGDCLICQDCYQETISDMRKGLKFEMEDELVVEERMCSMYSPRMREKFAQAVDKNDATELVEYSRERMQVWIQTIPQIKMLRQMQEMQMMTAMSAGMAGLMYQGAAGIQSIAGSTDGYLHGNSSVGWHDTENGAMSGQKFNEMQSGMAAANSGGTWGQIFMLQMQWEKYE